MLKRRQQLLLQSTKVDQVVPAPRRLAGQTVDAAAGDRDAPPVAKELGILPDFYNGYSRDQKASVSGAIAKSIGSVVWHGSSEMNTPDDEDVHVPFEIDPMEQMVVFSDHVYLHGGGVSSGFIKRPQLILETSAFVTDAITGEPIRYELLQTLGGNAPSSERSTRTFR